MLDRLRAILPPVLDQFRARLRHLWRGCQYPGPLTNRQGEMLCALAAARAENDWLRRQLEAAKRGVEVDEVRL